MALHRRAPGSPYLISVPQLRREKLRVLVEDPPGPRADCRPAGSPMLPQWVSVSRAKSLRTFSMFSFDFSMGNTSEEQRREGNTSNVQQREGNTLMLSRERGTH